MYKTNITNLKVHQMSSDMTFIQQKLDINRKYVTIAATKTNFE